MKKTLIALILITVSLSQAQAAHHDLQIGIRQNNTDTITFDKGKLVTQWEEFIGVAICDASLRIIFDPGSNEYLLFAIGDSANLAICLELENGIFYEKKIKFAGQEVSGQTVVCWDKNCIPKNVGTSDSYCDCNTNAKVKMKKTSAHTTSIFHL